jgi:hypothetical protein
MEMAQHVLRCAAPVGQQRLGRIVVGRLGEHFWVLCANRIDAQQRARLSARLDAVRALSAGTRPPDAPCPLPGADAGDDAGPDWLNIARDSSAPLEYGFFNTPLQDGAPSTHLHVRAWI